MTFCSNILIKGLWDQKDIYFLMKQNVKKQLSVLYFIK
jgi:hypothetical protein